MKRNRNTKNINLVGKGSLARIIYAGLILIVLVYIIRNSVIVPYVLEKHPTCIKAIIYQDKYSGGYLGRRIAYSFKYNSKEYTGTMKEIKNLEIGDSIYIVFLKSFPSINKPLSYFNEEKLKCNCK